MGSARAHAQVKSNDCYSSANLQFIYHCDNSILIYLYFFFRNVQVTSNIHNIYIALDIALY